MLSVVAIWRVRFEIAGRLHDNYDDANFPLMRRHKICMTRGCFAHDFGLIKMGMAL